MSCTGHSAEQPGDKAATDAVFTSLLEDSAEDLYESAPCGYLSTLLDGTMGESRELYGDEALRDFAAAHPGVGPHGLVGALTGLLDGFGDGLDDDTALLALGVPASPTPSRSDKLT